MNPFIDFLSRGLDGANYRQKLLANNIANINTPEFKRQDVDFVSALEKESEQFSNGNGLSVRTTDSGHIGLSNGFKDSNRPFKMIHMTNTSNRNDGNNVDVDTEMAEMAKNNIYYNTLIQQVSDRFKFLNSVIDKGGRQ
ncbi:MAG: flagellar basal body rod protein FlgB [Halanaerobiales bacterium]